MAVTAAQLLVKVSGDTKGAEDSLDKLNKRTNESGGFFKNLLSTAVGTFTGMMGVQSVTDAVGFLKNQLVDTVKAGMEAQQAQAQLTQGLKSTHDASGETTQSLEDLADKYSRLTTFSKTAIEQSEAVTLSFTKIGKDIFPQTTMAAEDLATRMGTDLPSATLELDKALGNPIQGITALTRVGVVFTAQQKEQIKAMTQSGNVAGAQKIILGELQKEFGGSAQAAGGTFAGQLQILSNQLEDTKEKIGMALLPVLNQLLKAIMPLVSWISTLIGNGLGVLSSFLTNTLVPAFNQVGPFFQQTATWLGNLLSGTNHVLKPLGSLGGSISSVGKALAPLKDPLNAAGDAFKSIGGSVGKVTTNLAPLKGPLSDAASAFGKVHDAVSPVQMAFDQVGNSLKLQLIPFVKQVGQFIRTDLMPAVQALMPHVQQFGNVLLNDVAPVLIQVGGAIGSVAISLASGLMSELQAVLPVLLKVAGVCLDNLGGAIKALTPLVLQVISGVKSFADFISTKVMPVIGQMQAFFLNSLVPILKTLFNVFKTDIVPILQTLWNNIQQNVIPAVEQIWGTISSQLIPALEKLWAKISPVLIPALQFLGNLLKATLTPILNAVGWALGHVVGPAISGAITIISKMIDAITTIISKIGDFLGLLGHVKDAVGNAFGGVGSALHNFHIPGFATGGTMPDTGLAVVGERGPELVKLPGGSQVAPIPSASSLLSGSGVTGLPAGMSPVYGTASGSMNGQPIQLTVNLDGRAVAQIVTKHQPSVIRQSLGVRNF